MTVDSPTVEPITAPSPIPTPPSVRLNDPPEEFVSVTAATPLELTSRQVSTTTALGWTDRRRSITHFAGWSDVLAGSRRSLPAQSGIPPPHPALPIVSNSGRRPSYTYFVNYYRFGAPPVQTITPPGGSTKNPLSSPPTRPSPTDAH